jgi:hypothetical protein
MKICPTNKDGVLKEKKNTNERVRHVYMPPITKQKAGKCTTDWKMSLSQSLSFTFLFEQQNTTRQFKDKVPFSVAFRARKAVKGAALYLHSKSKQSLVIPFLHCSDYDRFSPPCSGLDAEPNCFWFYCLFYTFRQREEEKGGKWSKITGAEIFDCQKESAILA